jgi:lipopolysaccharide biosynthesis protein
MRAQVAMARAAGVHGFVFYYSWFNGQRLLERPIERFLADRSVDMPFCLMWANDIACGDTKNCFSSANYQTPY